MEHSNLALQMTAYQLVLIIAPVLLLVAYCHTASKLLRYSTSTALGPKLYLWTFDFTGTIVHELSHAIAVILGGCKIDEMKLFDPKPDSPRGYVNYSYNKHSIWSRLGLCFIGIAPVIFGGALIAVLARWLLGDLVSNPWRLVYGASWSFSTWYEASRMLLEGIWGQREDLRLYAFLVLTIMIGSGMHLSRADIRTSVVGFGSLLLLLLVINLGVTFFAPKQIVTINHLLSAGFWAAGSLLITVGTLAGIIGVLLHPLAFGGVLRLLTHRR